ncbi:MAG: exopolysaccharide biosynthesis polyprenyl glycosylphosphotransferase [Bauldia sp.]|nr:exopolysaccharide biosynthesis polyprenyl glycosylphosphotransferase [Bauldia sp.]
MKYFRNQFAGLAFNPGIDIRRESRRSPRRLAKTSIDMAGALAALLLFSPLLLIVALLIKLDSRGPVFFKQTRVGVNGTRFRIYKFRTMRTLDDGAEIKQATRNDARITRIGRWLRATSIDELPQLINVLRGEMSIVGPRPHAVAHDNQYEPVIAEYAKRHQVKPGITGWAQVCGYRGETPNDELMRRRVEHDLWYIENWSLGLDTLIVARTVWALARPQNAY